MFFGWVDQTGVGWTIFEMFNFPVKILPTDLQLTLIYPIVKLKKQQDSVIQKVLKGNDNECYVLTTATVSS